MTDPDQKRPLPHILLSLENPDGEKAKAFWCEAFESAPALDDPFVNDPLVYLVRAMHLYLDGRYDDAVSEAKAAQRKSRRESREVLFYRAAQNQKGDGYHDYPYQDATLPPIKFLALCVEGLAHHGNAHPHRAYQAFKQAKAELGNFKSFMPGFAQHIFLEAAVCAGRLAQTGSAQKRNTDMSLQDKVAAAFLGLHPQNDPGLVPWIRDFLGAAQDQAENFPSRASAIGLSQDFFTDAPADATLH